MTNPPDAPPRYALATGRQKILGHLAMILFAALVAGSFSFGDMAASHIAPAAINFVRFVIGTCLMAALSFLIFKSAPVVSKGLWRFMILGALMAAFFVLMFTALQISGPVSTGAMFALIPLMSAGFGWLFLRQTTNGFVLLTLLVAATGSTWVIFRGDLDAILSLKLGRGESLFFFGCAAHAAYAPLVRKFNRGEPVLKFTVMTLAATALCILLYGFRDVASTDWEVVPGIVWLVVAYLSIFTTAGTFFLLQFASMRLPASKTLAYGYLTPIFVILYEGLLGHGWVSFSVAAGALITACALLMMALASDV